MSTPEQIAAGFERAAAELGGPKQLIQRITYRVQRRVQQRTRVDTGTLRRSMYGKVLTAQRGVVGSNLPYLRFQKNKPLDEGLDDALPEVNADLLHFGLDVLGEIG